MAELAARIVRMGKAGSASRLAAALVAAIGSQQGRGSSPKGLIAPANEPGRAAHLLAVLNINLARVEIAPLEAAAASSSDALLPLLAAQQVCVRVRVRVRLLFGTFPACKLGDNQIYTQSSIVVSNRNHFSWQTTGG